MIVGLLFVLHWTLILPSMSLGWAECPYLLFKDEPKSSVDFWENTVIRNDVEARYLMADAEQTINRLIAALDTQDVRYIDTVTFITSRLRQNIKPRNLLELGTVMQRWGQLS